MQTNINVQELTVEAIVSGDMQHARHAAMLDPHTAAELSLQEISALVDELLEAHGDRCRSSAETLPDADERRAAFDPGHRWAGQA